MSIYNFFIKKGLYRLTNPFLLQMVISNFAVFVMVNEQLKVKSKINGKLHSIPGLCKFFCKALYVVTCKATLSIHVGYLAYVVNVKYGNIFT